VARLLLVPALLGLVFAFAAGGSRIHLATAAAGALVLTLVHPTYLVYTAILAGSFAGARALLDRSARRDGLRGLAAVGVIVAAALAALAWLAPIVRQTAAFSPSAAETRRALARYGAEVTAGGATYALRPGFLAWGGAATVAALVAVPLAALAAQRGWAAYVAGPTAVLGAIALLPPLFTRFADAVSLSQALRVGGFLPLAVALAGAAELVGAAGVAAPLLGLASGVAAVVAYPGSTLGSGWAVVLAVTAAGAILAVGALGLLPGLRLPPRAPWTATAAAAFLVPVLVMGLSHLRRYDTPDPYALTPGLVRALNADVGSGEVVLSNVETSYRIAGAAPVFVAASLPGHVARTPANRPYERQWDAVRFFFRPSVTDGQRWAILRRYGAGWVVVDERQRFPPFVDRLQLVYRDARYRVYRVPAVSRTAA
jgi:hypothetical protein